MSRIFDAPETSDDEDEQLRVAIALSLAASSPPAASSSSSNPAPTPSRRPGKRKLVNTIDLTSDDEGEQLPAVKKARGNDTDKARPSPANPPRALGGLDRKQMELERLERQKKRKAPEGSEKIDSAVAPNSFYGSKGKAVAEPSEVRAPIESKRDILPKSSKPKVPNQGVQFPEGVVKKTAVEGYNRQGDDISIQEVLQKETLTTIVLSSFQWHYEWLLTILPFRKKDVNFYFCFQGKSAEERLEKEHIFAGLSRMSLVFPSMEGQINCMHSKLMLLFHKNEDKEWLRVVVPTANLTEYDWGGQGGCLENMVFLIDLPKLASPKHDQTFFMRELLVFCGAKDIPDEVLHKVADYDFSKTKGMAFVHTIGGTAGANEWNHTGFPGLATAIRKLGYSAKRGLEVDYVTSSLGAANSDFISCIYRAAMGHNGLRELMARSGNAGKSKKAKAKSKRELSRYSKAMGKLSDNIKKEIDDAYESEDDGIDLEHEYEPEWNNIRPRFRMYFPSRDTVKQSKGDIGTAGTICFQEPWWKNPNFPKAILFDCKSVREKLLMHNKMLFARPSHQLDGQAGPVDAWAYVGSANLSESAWGKLVFDKRSNTPKLNCRNWECGVIVPVKSKPMGRTLSGKEVEVVGQYPMGMDVFKGRVPVPMKLPGEAMMGKQPWFFQELVKQHLGPR